MAGPIQVRAFARRLGRGDTLFQATRPHHRRDSAMLYFDFPLAAGAEETITYTVETQE